MNQVSALEGQRKQCSLNSSLGDTIGSPLVHLGGQLLNGSTSIHSNASLQPSFNSVFYGRICHIIDYGHFHFYMHGILLLWWGQMPLYDVDFHACCVNTRMVSAGCVGFWSYRVMISHTCSIGDRSGEFAGRGNMSTLCGVRCVTTRE
ncbi:hypothetical protein TNCV_3921831 [Trichonephila clavipes]|nr:hypothetical protein TNCV_3921831 [Trichonephila clavipes]